MHIWSCLKNFLYDKDNFIALYDNYIYIYNFTKVLSISNKEIKMLIQDKKVKISGLDLKIIKCSKQEILITGTLGGIVYEWRNLSKN